MGMSFRIDEKQRLIFTKLSGIVDNWNLGIGVQALLEDPRFDRQFSRLVDATEASDVNALSSDFLESVAQDLSSGTKIALVGSKEMQQTLRVYQSHLKSVDCRLFDDKETALAWLGVVERPRFEEFEDAVSPSSQNEIAE
jgi:hypothetical protein